MKGPSESEPARAVRALGGRIACAAALGVALLSLWRHAPVWLACLRGGATLLLIGLAAGLGSAALAWAIEFDRRSADAKGAPRR